MSSQEQLEAARAILAITARLPVVNANAVGEVTAEELLETPVDELSPEQSEKIIRTAKRETAEALWRTELAPRDPKVARWRLRSSRATGARRWLIRLT